MPHNNSFFISIKSSKYDGTRLASLPAVATANTRYDYTTELYYTLERVLNLF